MALIDALTRRATDAFLEGISGRFDVRGSVLFGSRARESHRIDSDADIAIFLNGSPSSFTDTKLAMADFAFDVLLETGILIQPLPIWEQEWLHPESYSNPHLLAAIKKEGIPL